MTYHYINTMVGKQRPRYTYVYRDGKPGTQLPQYTYVGNQGAGKTVPPFTNKLSSTVTFALTFGSSTYLPC